MMPGITPAINNLTIEVSAITAYMIIGMLGGMIMAEVAEADVTAAEKFRGYPFFLMAGMRMLPRAAASATADPDISAKNIEVTIFTMASPPRINPTRALAKLINLCEMPAEFIKLPVSTNRGMANRGKLSAPLNNLKGTVRRSTPCISIAKVAVNAKANPMGTCRRTRPTTRMRMIHSI